MHDGMLYEPIQGQRQGHRAFEVLKIALFKVCLLRRWQWELANDHWFLNYSTISKFVLVGFLPLVLVFVWPDLKLGGVPAVSLSTKKFNEILYVDRARWVVHDSMPYDLIQGQGQVNKCLKVTQEESTVSPTRD